MLKQIRPAVVMIVAMTIIYGPHLPPGHDRRSPSFPFPRQANGSLQSRRMARSIGSELIGQNFTADNLFPRLAVGDDGNRSQRF